MRIFSIRVYHVFFGHEDCSYNRSAGQQWITGASPLFNRRENAFTVRFLPDISCKELPPRPYNTAECGIDQNFVFDEGMRKLRWENEGCIDHVLFLVYKEYRKDIGAEAFLQYHEQVIY